jgi:glyoxylase-like metal-dependent hydrolase (beta-lactamase superfamily II)
LFHEFHIGALRALVVSDGPLILPAARDIFTGPPASVLDAALAKAGLPQDAVHVEQNCLLVEASGRRVLFDNGLGTAKIFGPHSGRLLDSLAEAGVTPDTIDLLVLTHAHSDHCWGTMADHGSPNFPNAGIAMSEAELAFWESEPAGVGRRSIGGVRKHLLPLRERISFLRDGEDVLPGIQAWHTPGHTPGHLAFLFDGGAGERWCLSGDVAFHDPLSYAFPSAESAFDTDPSEGARTRARVLDRLAGDRLRVIGYHNPWPGLGRVERAGEGFRFIGDGDTA